MLPRPVAAVVFDMDGTLHDTEAVYLAAMKQAIAAVGFAVTDAFCHSLIGIPGLEGDEMIRQHLGPAFPFATFDERYNERVRHALNQAIPVKPGVEDTLAMLAAGGVKVAIATSARRESAEHHLERSGLRRHFPIVVTRSDVARGKPFPDLFLLAADRLGVPPGDCLAVEDSFNGIRAAHAAGMMAVMVPDILQPTEDIRALCVHVARDMHEVGAMLAAQRLSGSAGSWAPCPTED